MLCSLNFISLKVYLLSNPFFKTQFCESCQQYLIYLLYILLWCSIEWIICRVSSWWMMWSAGSPVQHLEYIIIIVLFLFFVNSCCCNRCMMRFSVVLFKHHKSSWKKKPQNTWFGAEVAVEAVHADKYWCCPPRCARSIGTDAPHWQKIQAIELSVHYIPDGSTPLSLQNLASIIRNDSSLDPMDRHTFNWVGF